MERGQPYSQDMRRAAASRAMVDAKIAEYGSHIWAGDHKAAEEAHNAASAALDAHLDLTRKNLEAEIRKGY